ncbi:unnamed protein product [Allacma fusca]|uniref:Protein SZT2 n=1 Tax=Allacma fusca TaxID=39272 RepID=A0A8J2KXP9_9HEXA|nr:unnamed protein product [Allacma fusca]
MESENTEVVLPEVLDADQVYVLMSNEYRISRNRRAEWFFSHLNTVVSIPRRPDLNEFEAELELISAVPKNPPTCWSPALSHLFQYKVSSRTTVNFLARKYRLVYCLDISSSVASVDVQAGLVMFEGIYDALKASMEALVRPFYVPGSPSLFQPRIFVTVIAHAPFLASVPEQVLIQGVLLSPETVDSVIRIVFDRLTKIESKVAEVTASISEAMENAQEKSDRIIGQIFDEESSSSAESALAMSPDFGFVDLLRQALIGVHLLSENSTAGLIIVTDGVISVPDGGYLDAILSQLRYNTVSCSFIQLSSPFHPHLCYGVLPYADLMRFISCATFGAFLTSIPEIKDDNSSEMNIYQSAFLSWSFQKGLEGFKISVNPPNCRPGEWSVRNKCFFSVRDMPIVKKQQYETSLSVDYVKILSCRLREGFTIKEVNTGQDNLLEIKLTLPWKFNIQIEYVLTTTPTSQPKVSVWLEGPYDFVHDVTCLVKKPFQSYYRQLMVTRFWSSQKNLSESDKLLVHFNLLSTNQAFYNIPDSLRNGVPLFYISSSNSAPVLMSSDFESAQSQFAQFIQFWKPVCSLDTTIWQKWMHTHSIGIILEHDHPLPKSLHMPNTSGRYHIIQCRQAVMALNTLLKDWSSFVLVENHSYVKLMYNDNEKPPSSFYIIRVTSKPPCVVLRLAFLVGTPGNLRHEAVTVLREKISDLTFPQRLKDPLPEWRNVSPNPSAAEEPESSLPKGNYRKSRSLPCCTLLHKPVEKILIRYERVPRNLFKTLLPQNLYNNLTSPKAQSNQQSTFGFRPTFHTPSGLTIKMGPETFNTVARYLHHRRWIWCVQSTSASPLSLNCASQILSTLTKMRLQEGFRFANSAAGTVNMLMELFMNTESPEIESTLSVNQANGSLEQKQADLTPCILQYVIFPPVTSLESNSDDEEEGESESVDDMGELYLVTECWIEPQYGKVVCNDQERQYMDGLEYSEVPKKIFEIDRECISAIVTFEHLSLMCKDEKVPSPTHIAGSQNRGSRYSLPNDYIKSIPFAFELNRILPKSQQAEILFSMFTQDLSMSFPININNEFSSYCDEANNTLYEAWSLNISKLHDREVFFADEEHATILKIISERERIPDVNGLSVIQKPELDTQRLDSRRSPRWRCFIKGITHTHVILTLLPASYKDLKVIMLTEENMKGTPDVNNSVRLLSDKENVRKEGEDLPYLISERSIAELSDYGDGRPRTSTPLKDDGQAKAFECPKRNVEICATLAGRKRSRVKSGGESGPLAKKSLNHRNTSDNAFRFRAGSMDTFAKIKTATRLRTKSADDKAYPETNFSSSPYVDLKNPGFGPTPTKIESPQFGRRFFTENHRPKYGSITLPVFSYDCSLSQLVEHVIKQSASGKSDIFLDCRVDAEGVIMQNDADDTTSTEEVPQAVEKPKTLRNTKTEPEFLRSRFLRTHCQALEIAWRKSYVHGLFESLQHGLFIHHSDINVAMKMCQRFQIDVDLNDFIATICGHFKEAKQKESGFPELKDKSETSTTGGKKASSCRSNLCREKTSVHSFIKKRFQNIMLATFNLVSDHSSIFYFKFMDNDIDLKHGVLSERADRKDKMDTVRMKDSLTSGAGSSKNTSDFDEMESLTVKAESACSEFLRIPSKEDISQSPDLDNCDPLLSQEIIFEEGCEMDPDCSGPVPLFLYLTYSFKYKDLSGEFDVRDIPTCVDEIIGEVEHAISSPDEEIDLNQLVISMQFVFLTVPPEVDDIDKSFVLPTGGRTFSVCSGSSLPTPKEEALPIITTEQVTVESEKIKKKYPNLPPYQLLAVKKTVDDVKWLLKDEITSFRWESDPLTDEVLTLVSSHVQRSVGKQGCQLCIRPLTFVDNSSLKGFEKFKERFRRLSVDGFRLKEEGSWFYLVCCSRNSLPNKEQLLTEEKIEEEPAPKNRITEELLRNTLYKQTLVGIDSDTEDAEIAEIANKTKETIEDNSVGKFGELENHLNTVSKSSSMENISKEVIVKNECPDPQTSHRIFLATPSQMSEISSLVGSIITNEEGYDGDGSDSGGEDGGQSDLDSRSPILPPFWMIFKLNTEQILTYFQCRYNEDDLTMYNFSNKLREKILGISMRLRRIVNQDLLLQQLHDTRHCSPLLEPENDETDVWEGREVSLSFPSSSLTNPEEIEYDVISQVPESSTDFAPGAFSCDIVWETKFFLHSRLRTGPGKTLLSRGIQTLQTTLIAFEVINRKNMFVYRDSCGNVFYLRLYRMQDASISASPNYTDNTRSDSRSEGKNKPDYEDNTQENRVGYSSGKDLPGSDNQGSRPYSEDVVLLQVHGITEAGPEIKEQLVQSLRNKLDDSILDILSVTLDRNPHCKLTPEDVHFIQKPFSPPDIILKYEVNSYATKYLPAFSYYLHQNLLQFLHVPKYTDFKSENHFQDYSRYGEEGIDCNERNIYMYNQSPGGTGSRGIACLAVTLIDNFENVIKVAESVRPASEAFSNVIQYEEFSEITAAEEISSEGNCPDVMLELRVWKQGRINIDHLKSFFSTAVKHCMWDLYMEFYFLTAPLSTNTSKPEISSSEPTTPMLEQNSKAEQSKDGMAIKSPMVSLTSLKFSTGTPTTGVIDSKEFMRALERRNSANLPPLLHDRADVETPRARSMSFSARKPAPTLDGRQIVGRAPSPLTLSQSHSAMGMMSSKPKFQIDPGTIGLTRYESGDCGSLHTLYCSLMKQWCSFGSNLSVPSLRIFPIHLQCRHDVEVIAQEVEKIIQSVAPDNVPRQFWNTHSTGKDCFMSGTLKSNSSSRIEVMQRVDSELKSFKRSLKRLKELEKQDETEYPADLLELFKISEDFNPANGGNRCIITARNLIHWKSCVTSEVIMDTLCIPEVPKNNYKFLPLMVGSMETNLFGGSPSSSSLEKMSRVSSTNGLSSLSNDTELLNNPLLIPRQRFLMACVSSSKISFIFYNWSKESSDRLIEQTKCLALWLNARSSVLTSILSQKAGLFCSQPIQNSATSNSICAEGNPFISGGVEVEVLIKNHAPPKEHSTGRLAALKKPKSPKALAPFLECYRNIKHASMLKIPEGINLLKAQGDQLLQNKIMEKKDSQNSLFQYWLLRGPSASNMIGMEGIESFKQSARIIHYCMTPIIFLPRWRTDVAATRDSTLGTLKKARNPTDGKKLQFVMKPDSSRSRHNSGASQRSLESNKTRSRSSIWGLWGNSSSTGNVEAQASHIGLASAASGSKKLDEKWHSTLCESFIQEYMQYLQSLGFIPITNKANGRKRLPSKKEPEPERNRHLSGASFTSLVSSSSSQSGSSIYGFASFGNYVRRTREESGDKVLHYLQKSLPGGILLFEIGLADPFFYAKLYALEATRIQRKKTRKVAMYQKILAFLDECDKVKVSMHLHSFTYDFHLRSIHSYLSGRQLIFKQGYHLTNFLDDFIKYYPKGPNFARNTVRIGMVTVQNVSTPSHILYNYILSHEKLYKMRVIRMTLQHPEMNEVVNEFVLTQLSSKKVAYKDIEDESQCDEFDLTLLIAHDTPPFARPYSVDPSVLRLKYYIVLTSRRELYPKLVEETRQGKLCIVNTPEALAKQKVTSTNNKTDSKPSSRRPSLSEPLTFNVNDPQPMLSMSSEKEGSYSDTRARKPSTDKNFFEGIKEEQVNYMGYFSSHEQMMQTIVNEQVVEIEKEINGIVSKASIDCRRDLLWQRLLVGGQIDEKNSKNKKEDLNSRETVGALTYWEFSEMLELVQVRSLSEMDTRLTSLLKQPITFYENLLRLLTIKHEQFYRYFVAPDKSTRQMAIFSPNVQQSVVMIDINLDKLTADLSVVFKEIDEKRDLRKTVELEGDILNLIESVVNACCYCCWTTLV